VRDVLGRLDGKVKSASLREHPGFKPWPADMQIGATFHLNTTALFDGMTRSRSSRWSFDRADAVFGFSAIRNGWGRVRFEEGQISGEFELSVGKECSLYHDLVRQKNGPRELLKFIPDDVTQMFHVNVENGEAFRKQLQTFLDRVERKSYEEFRKEVERLLNVWPEELAKTVGSEVALYVDADELQAQKGLGILVKGVSAPIVERIQAAPLLRGNGWESLEFRGVRVHVSKVQGEPAYAIVGDVLICGLGRGTVERAIKANLDNMSLASRKLPPGSSKMIGSGLRGYVKLFGLVLSMTGNASEELAEIEKNLSEKAFDVAVVAETDSGWSVRSSGWGGFAMPFLTLGGLMTARASEPRPVPAVEPGPVDDEKIDIPKDAEKLIPSLIADLGAEEAAVRENATRRLRAIGRPAVPALVKASSSSDPEVRDRAMRILVSLKAYDAVPEILDLAIRQIVQSFKESENDNEEVLRAYWNPSSPGAHHMEPYKGEVAFWPDARGHMPGRNADMSVLDSAHGLKALARKLGDTSLGDGVRHRIARLLSRFDTSECGEELLKALDATKSEDLQAWILICLGPASEPKAQARLREALKSASLARRRGAFIGAERSRDRATVDALFELVDSKDAETSFNATYTLRRVTRGRVDLNGFLPQETLKERLKQARRNMEEKHD
jgi:hypothetical protein